MAGIHLESVIEGLTGALSPNTLRAYKADNVIFLKFCEKARLDPYPASASTLLSFIGARSLEAHPRTIERQLFAIQTLHQAMGLSHACDSVEVRIAMRKLKRLPNAPQMQAQGMTIALRDQLLAVTDESLKGARDRALLHLAFESMRRRSELVAFLVSDWSQRMDGTSLIQLRRSKTDQDGTGFIMALSHQCTEAIDEWLSQANISEGPLLRSIHKDGVSIGQKAMHDRSIGRIYHWLAEKAGIPKADRMKLSAHSSRVGPAQELLMRGETVPQIMRRGGWTSPDMVARYTKHSDLDPLPF
jgi:site-specific recombinase XerD